MRFQQLQINLEKKREKRERVSLLAYGIKKLNYACQKLVKEKLLREKLTDKPFTWARWAEEKKLNPDTLMTRYFRCEEKLTQILRLEEQTANA